MEEQSTRNKERMEGRKDSWRASRRNKERTGGGKTGGKKTRRQEKEGKRRAGKRRENSWQKEMERASWLRLLP